MFDFQLLGYRPLTEETNLLEAASALDCPVSIDKRLMALGLPRVQ